jgi:plasmid stabilization system protein ParE
VNYTVLCSSTAEEQLAAAFLASGDRRAVTAAARAIDEILRAAPLAFGESRDGELRVAFEPPLAVWFTVTESDRTVVIVRFRLRETG